MVNATLQAASLSALSNLLAQGLEAYRGDVCIPKHLGHCVVLTPRQKRFVLDIVPIMHFVLFTFLSCPSEGVSHNFEHRRSAANSVQKFWPLVSSGLKLWPMVSLLNFTVVPVNRRVVVGSLVGLFWGIYLSLMVSGDSH